MLLLSLSTVFENCTKSMPQSVGHALRQKVMQIVSFWLCQWILQPNAGNSIALAWLNSGNEMEARFPSFSRWAKQYFSYKLMCQRRSLEQQLECWIHFFCLNWSFQSYNRSLVLYKIGLKKFFIFKNCSAFWKCWSSTYRSNEILYCLFYCLQFFKEFSICTNL